jgi:hypothetical protein
MPRKESKQSPNRDEGRDLKTVLSEGICHWARRCQREGLAHQLLESPEKLQLLVMLGQRQWLHVVVVRVNISANAASRGPPFGFFPVIFLTAKDGW